MTASPVRRTGGFTFIEVLVGLSIVTIAALGIMFGTVYARSHARTVMLENRALDELQGMMEYWKARLIYAGKRPLTPIERSGGAVEHVLLYSVTGDRDGEIWAEMRREPIRQKVMGGIDFYELGGVIEWEDPSAADWQDGSHRRSKRLDVVISPWP